MDDAQYERLAGRVEMIAEGAAEDLAEGQSEASLAATAAALARLRPEEAAELYGAALIRLAAMQLELRSLRTGDTAVRAAWRVLAQRDLVGIDCRGPAPVPIMNIPELLRIVV